MDRIATHLREPSFQNFNLFHMQFPACFVGLNFCNCRNQFQLCFSPTVDDLLLHSPRELLLQGEDKRDWGVWEEQLGAGCIAGQPWCTLLPFCIFLWACILFILFQRREGLFPKPWIKNLSSRVCQVTKPEKGYERKQYSSHKLPTLPLTQVFAELLEDIIRTWSGIRVWQNSPEFSIITSNTNIYVKGFVHHVLHMSRIENLVVIFGLGVHSSYLSKKGW